MEYRFKRILNTSEPCPQCGVPACGNENILFYEENRDQVVALIFDRSLLDLNIEEFLKLRHQEEYPSHPLFIRNWNECKGWAEHALTVESIIDADDFLESLHLFAEEAESTYLPETAIVEMKTIALESISKGKSLKIGEY